MAPRRSARANKGVNIRLQTPPVEEEPEEALVVENDDDPTIQREDDPTIRCACNADDEEGFMVQCDDCDKWQHGRCMGYDDEDDVPDTFLCHLCRPETSTQPAVNVRSQPAIINKSIAKRKVAVVSPSDVSEIKASFKEDSEEERENLTKRRKLENTTPEDSGSDYEEEQLGDEAMLSRRNNEDAENSKQTLEQITPKRIEVRQSRQSEQKSNATKSTRKTSTTKGKTETTAPSKSEAVKLVSAIADLTNPTRSSVAKLFIAPLKAVLERQGDEEKYASSKAEEIALQIEFQIFTVFCPLENNQHPITPKYKEKARSIKYNLGDPNNPNLRKQVSDGQVTPEVLVHMTAEQMANPEIRLLAESIRKQSTINSVIKETEAPRIRRTHKGEEYVGGDAAALPERPVTKNEGDASEINHDSPIGNSPDKLEILEGQPEDQIDIYGGGSPLGSIPDIAEDIDIPSPGQYEWQAKNDDPHLSPVTNPVAEATSPISGAGSPVEKKNDTELKSATPPYSPPYSPGTNDDNTPAEAKTIWSGVLTMAGKAELHGQADLVSDPKFKLRWKEALPPKIIIEGRIVRKDALKYVLAQYESGTKDVIGLHFRPSSPDQAVLMQELYDYFRKRERFGVLHFKSAAVKDAYLMPLESSEPLPEQLNCTRPKEAFKTRSDNGLYGIVVLNTPNHRPSVSSASNGRKGSQHRHSISSQHRSSSSKPSHAPSNTDALRNLSETEIIQKILADNPHLLTDKSLLENPESMRSLITKYIEDQAK